MLIGVPTATSMLTKNNWRKVYTNRLLEEVWPAATYHDRLNVNRYRMTSSFVKFVYLEAFQGISSTSIPCDMGAKAVSRLISRTHAGNMPVAFEYTTRLIGGCRRDWLH